MKNLLMKAKNALNNKMIAIAPIGAMVMTGVASAEGETTTVLSSVVTADLLNGVFDEIVGLLPVCIPVMVGFLAIRKGISFVRGIVQGA